MGNLLDHFKTKNTFKRVMPGWHHRALMVYDIEHLENPNDPSYKDLYEVSATFGVRFHFDPVVGTEGDFDEQVKKARREIHYKVFQGLDGMLHELRRAVMNNNEEHCMKVIDRLQEELAFKE